MIVLNDNCGYHPAEPLSVHYSKHGGSYYIVEADIQIMVNFSHQTFKRPGKDNVE